MADRDPGTEKLDAQFREADARLDVLKAQAEARKAAAEMEAISGLRAARERARQQLADLKQTTSKNLEASRRVVEGALHDLQVGIDRISERYGVWDEARERRFNARLDEVEAKVKLWKARADEKRAELGVKQHDALAALEERTALARARVAEWNRARHERKAQEALEEAAHRFDEAYDAAAKRYDRR